MVKREQILSALPPYQNKWETIKGGTQTATDLVENVLNAHIKHASYYDLIFTYFDDGRSIPQILDELFKFCKKNIRYKEEPGERQTDALPTGLLTRGYGDCKHYSGFIAGILDAMCRAHRNVSWKYRFASNDPIDPTPHHVFIVVTYKGQEYWIDPVPGAQFTEPCYYFDARP